MDKIKAALVEPRRSLSPTRFTEDDFKRFKGADTHALKERQVTTSVIPSIQGEIGDIRCVAGEIPFPNLDPLTDGSLVPANPDLYCGADPKKLNR